MRSRSSKGSTSSRYSPVNEASVTVARSEPEPLTHSTRAVRPRKSTSSALAEVLPPPQLQTERSAPSLRERATNCASIVDVEVSVIASIPSLVKLKHLHRCQISTTVILSAAKDLRSAQREILRCAQDDSAPLRMTALRSG